MGLGTIHAGMLTHCDLFMTCLAYFCFLEIHVLKFGFHAATVSTEQLQKGNLQHSGHLIRIFSLFDRYRDIYLLQ